MTRLKVVNGSLTDEINGRMRTLMPGEMFDHPDDERTKRLLSITPAIVVAVNESPAPISPSPIPAKPVASAKAKTAPKT